MHCSNCGSQIAGNSKFCPNCGITLNNTTTNQNAGGFKNNYSYNGQNINITNTKKSPILALLLSLIIVGLGQLYLGDTKKAAIMFGLAIFFSLFSFGILWFAVAIWSAYDAYKTAKRL